MSDHSPDDAPMSLPGQKILEESDTNNLPPDESTSVAIPSIGSMEYHSHVKSSERVPVKRPTKRKPKDKPKRPLSAYNFFFKQERGKILAVLAELEEENKETSADGTTKVVNDPNDPDYLDDDTIGRLKKEGGKVSFEEMGKIIGQRWKNIDPDRLQKFSELAAEDTERYKKEMQSYNGRQEEKMRSEALKPAVPSYEMHSKPVGAPPSYSDPSMASMGGSGYGPPQGGYYGYPESYQYPSNPMYSPYGYPNEPMPPQQPMGGPPDTRSQPYTQGGSGYYGAPPGYNMGYGSGPNDAYGPPQGMEYPYGSYGGWGQQ